MASKTNAARLLDAAGIEYRLVEYPTDEDHLDAETVARSIAADPETVFKTLVAACDNGEVAVFCVPGSEDLDLKKAAAAAGCNKIHLVPVARLKALTGYVRGGCSPIGMTHGYPTYFDEVALLFDRIYVSAGRRGLQILISPDHLLEITNAEPADLV